MVLLTIGTALLILAMVPSVRTSSVSVVFNRLLAPLAIIRLLGSITVLVGVLAVVLPLRVMVWVGERLGAMLVWPTTECSCLIRLLLALACPKRMVVVKQWCMTLRCVVLW